MKEFDIEKLERKNIYTVPDRLFERVQGKVLSGVSSFDLEKLERKNIYAVSDNIYENVQDHVISKVFPRKNAPIFRMNWTYAAAASLALVFGAAFVLNNGDSSDRPDMQTAYAVNKPQPKTESEKAYETLKSDLTSVENTDQTIESHTESQPSAQGNAEARAAADTKGPASKTATKQNEVQVNEYLDAFSNSEISELASNSNQDVYLDLYN